MRYFRLKCVGDTSNEDFCFTDQQPQPIDSYDLIIGQPVEDEYPDGLDAVTLQLGEDYPGLELPSFIGNTRSMLIVNRGTADLLLSKQVGEVEVIPFKLLNHRGRVHSEDYVFLNPLGTVDCLDMDRTVCKRHHDGSIMVITSYVLSTAKLTGATHLIRPREAPREYFFSEELVAALAEAEATNFVFEELEQA